MGRNKLSTCTQAQQLVGIHAFGSINLLQYEVALGNGTGFIHNYGSNIFQSLHSNAAFKENAVLGAGADAGEEGSGTLSTSAQGQLITRKVSAV